MGCTEVSSSAEEVGRPGTWNVSFARLVDVDGPPYVVEQPALPEYPWRIMRAPVTDAASCAPGCSCEFVPATDDCTGDAVEHCRASFGFLETCASAHTILDCRYLLWDSDTHTKGVCVLEDSRTMDEFGYTQIRRYAVTFDRASYQ